MDFIKGHLERHRPLGKNFPRLTSRSEPSASARQLLQAFTDPPPRYGKEGEGTWQRMPAFLTRPLDVQWIDIEMMGHWLQKCDSEHGDECRKPFGLDAVHVGRPKLLIDVQRKNLVAAEPNHRYACLSYVWGNVPTLRTVKANIDRLKEDESLEFHRDEIPKTIRDTIGLCAQLGIPYLWVDALCVVQDDTASKHADIQAMAGIYANAYVTVVAANGWDANHGLRGIQGVTEPRHLTSTWKAGSVEDVAPYGSIWYSRGWTFQEMVFSPRIIMFEYQLAIWECTRDLWHETSLSRTSFPSAGSNIIRSVNPWKSRIQFKAQPDIEQYLSIAHDCALRKFTYAEDSLYGITSLLSVMSFSFVGGFISGLPEKFFDEALLWQPEELMQRRQASTRSNSPPSWSWVGWEGKISPGLWNHPRPFGTLLDSMYLQRGYPLTPLPPLHIDSGVRWFFGNTLDERVPIKVPGRNYVVDYEYRNDSGKHFPSELDRGDDATYNYHNDRKTANVSTLPDTSTPSPQVTTARFLFCRTKRGYFKWVPPPFSLRRRGSEDYIAIHDSNDEHIGYVNISNGVTNYEWLSSGRKCELVSISMGSLLPKDIDENNALGFGRVEPDTENGSQEFYNVLWIEWMEGVAYRKGLGRVSRSGFHTSEPDDIDLVLG